MTWYLDTLPKPLEQTNQEDFLYHAFHFNRQKIYGSSSYSEDPVTKWLYKAGRDLGILNMDFVQFDEILADTHKHYLEGVRRKKPIVRWQNHSMRWYRRWYGRRDPKLFRVMPSYKRAPHHEKKKKDTKKEAWWAEKQFRKDRRKNYGRRNWKRFMKAYSHKVRRNQERLLKASYNWSSFRSIENPGLYVDKWSYD